MQKKSKIKKRKWCKPQLIILVRGKPEEMALLVCKIVAFGSGDPTLIHSYCRKSLFEEPCVDCSDISQS